MAGNTPRVPVRSCVGCRRVRPKDELLRVAKTPTGVAADPEARLPGRGAYVCPDPRCITTARRRGAAALRRSLRGAREHEGLAALDELHAMVVDHLVPDGTVRSENA